MDKKTEDSVELGPCIAFLAHKQGRALFALVPKAHVLQHIVIELDMQSETASHAMNPLVWSVQPDEDFIGRPSRLSRRVSAVTVVKRISSRVTATGSMLATLSSLPEKRIREGACSCFHKPSA